MSTEYSQAVRDVVRAIGARGEVHWWVFEGKEFEAIITACIHDLAAYSANGTAYSLTDKGRKLLREMQSEEKAPKSDRYPMCTDQPAQIDCRRERCKFHAGGGNCTNSAPAITLNGPPSMTNEKGACWSYKEREPEPEPEPSWDDAPDWARWKARDKGSKWCPWGWYENRPKPGRSRWWKTTGLAEHAVSLCYASNPNWRDTLQARPEPDPLCPVCGKPASEHKSGLFWGYKGHTKEWPCSVCDRPASEHEDGLFCCPHCGASRDMLAVLSMPTPLVWCKDCGARTETTPPTTVASAIAAWNRRA